MKRNTLEIALTNAIRIGIPGVHSTSEGIRMGDEFFKVMPDGNYQRFIDSITSPEDIYTPEKVAWKLERYQESIWY